MLTNSLQARTSMIEGQLTPSGIVDSALLTAMKLVPREFFVPHDFAAAAYTDEELPLAAGRMLIKPLVLARLLQALALRGPERLLIIGGATGYSAAIAAHLVSEVVMVEEQSELIAQGKSAIPLLHLRNVELVETSLAAPKLEGTFDAILIEGAVQHVPAHIAALLAEGGRLAYVGNRALRQDGLRGAATGLGTLCIALKRSGGLVSMPLTEAGVTLLPGFAEESAFHFA